MLRVPTQKQPRPQPDPSNATHAAPPPTGPPFTLDIRMELDDTAAFRSSSKWGPGPVEVPLPFGRALTAAESYVASLDEATGERVGVGWEGG